MSDASPLYITGYTPDGRRLLGGVFRLKDQHGFPLDMSFEIAKENGFLIDYAELLSDAWFNDCLKFDFITRELDMLGGSHVEEWKQWAALWLSQNRLNQIDAFCRHVLTVKRM
jgi:hypothetical protein